MSKQQVRYDEKNGLILHETERIDRLNKTVGKVLQKLSGRLCHQTGNNCIETRIDFRIKLFYTISNYSGFDLINNYGGKNEGKASR